MRKICSNCGAVCPEADGFCTKCGGTEFQMGPDQSVSGGNAVLTTLRKVARKIMPYMCLILIAMAIFTLVVGIIHFSGSQEINTKTTISYNGESESVKQTVEMNDVAEMDEFIPFGICVLAYGGFNVVLTLMAALMLVKFFSGKKKMRRPLRRYALTGGIGNVVYLLLVAITGTLTESEMGMKATVRLFPNGIVWVSLVLFVLLYAILWLSKGRKRAAVR